MKKTFGRKDIKMNSTDTLIGAGTTFEGKLHSNASIRIDGTIRGNVSCKGDLYIGESAVLHSDVVAANIHHAGKIHGTITTSGTLYVAQSGKIYGDLDVSKVQIDEGALFEGTIIMKQPEEAKSVTSVPQKNDKVKVAK